MSLIADIFLIAGALGAAIYCVVLSRRLRRFTDLEKGVGGAVAVLSAQVDDMTKALQSAQSSAAATSGTLDGLTSRAEDAARRLELLVASMHDLPATEKPAEKPTGEAETFAAAPAERDIPEPAAPKKPADGPRPDEANASFATTGSAEAPVSSEGQPSTLFLSQRSRIQDAAG